MKGFLIDSTAKHGDNAVCKNEVYGCQSKTADKDQYYCIANAAFCPGGFISAQCHTDEGAAAVSDHDGDGKGNHGQRENHGVGCVAVRAQIAGIGNKDLIDDVVERANQQ